jgi:hypothetical protein
MQDETEIGYALKPLGNPKNPTHAQCTSCHEVKPIKDFKTMSTNAQAISWGYKKAIEIVSKKCSKCRKPRKKLKDLTLKEIHNKIATGDIKGGAYGEMVKEDRIAEGIRKKRLGVENRWRVVREKFWNDLLNEATKEQTRIRKAVHSAYNPTTPKPYNEHLANFNTAYHEALKNVRALFIVEKRLGRTTPDKNKQWQDYIGKDTLEELLKLWRAIPPEHKLYIKAPPILHTLTPTEGEEA